MNLLEPFGSHPRKSASLLILPILGLFSLSGCGVILGNVRPVTEKAEQYGILDLSKDHPETWSKIQTKSNADEKTHPQSTPSEVSDVAFQAIRSPSIIALNSGCRPSIESQAKELKELTNELILGFSEIQSRTEKFLTIEKVPALETTIHGKMSEKPIFLRTVVVRKNNCVYDLLYMSSPADFATHEKDFSNFVASLRIK